MISVSSKPAFLREGPRFRQGFRRCRRQRGRVDFRLAFAADLRSPDAFFFACERRASSPPDRGVLERHSNGVTGIATVVLSESNPTDFQYLLQEVADQRDVQAHSFGMDVDVPGGTISVLNPAGLSAWFGLERGRIAASDWKRSFFVAIPSTTSDGASSPKLSLTLFWDAWSSRVPPGRGPSLPFRRHHDISQPRRFRRHRHLRQRSAFGAHRRAMSARDAPACLRHGGCVEGDLCRDRDRLVYKSSYDKANRTSIGGKRGAGLETSMPIFDDLRRELELPILTDVSHPKSNARSSRRMSTSYRSLPFSHARRTSSLQRRPQARW